MLQYPLRCDPTRFLVAVDSSLVWDPRPRQEADAPRGLIEDILKLRENIEKQGLWLRGGEKG